MEVTYQPPVFFEAKLSGVVLYEGSQPFWAASTSEDLNQMVTALLMGQRRIDGRDVSHLRRRLAHAALGILIARGG